MTFFRLRVENPCFCFDPTAPSEQAVRRVQKKGRETTFVLAMSSSVDIVQNSARTIKGHTWHTRSDQEMAGAPNMDDYIEYLLQLQQQQQQQQRRGQGPAAQRRQQGYPLSRGTPRRQQTRSLGVGRGTTPQRQQQQRPSAPNGQGQTQPAPPAVDGYFWRGAPLDDGQRRYCRCVLHVNARNASECFSTPGALGQGRCYNPYAVCTASVGRQSDCSAYYAFTPDYYQGGITDDEVRAYAQSRGIPVGPTRRDTVNAIEEYLSQRKAVERR